MTDVAPSADGGPMPGHRPGTPPPQGTFAHSVLFYRDDDEYVRGTVAFVLGGLEAAEPVAVAVPGPNLETLRGAVRERAGDAAARVEWLDMSEAGRNPGRIIPGVLRAFADLYSGTRVRIIGEPVWPGRSRAEYPACVQHEALINLAFAGHRMTVLCPYDAGRLSAGAVLDAHATHPVIVDGDGERVSERYDPHQVIETFNRPLPEPAAPAETRPFDLSAVAQIRDLVCRRATALGLRPDRVGDLELAVNELAVNSALHGGGEGVLRIWDEDGHVVCEVSDAGRITDPLVGRLPAGLSSQGGRGVLMVNHLADLVRAHTRPDGTTIRIYVRLPA